jgi:hypothetical protein
MLIQRCARTEIESQSKPPRQQSVIRTAFMSARDSFSHPLPTCQSESDRAATRVLSSFCFRQECFSHFHPFPVDLSICQRNPHVELCGFMVQLPDIVRFSKCHCSSRYSLIVPDSRILAPGRSLQILCKERCCICVIRSDTRCVN